VHFTRAVEVCWGGPRSGAVVIPPPPSATPFLRLCVTITVPLAVTALCEKPIKPSCLCLVELAYVSFCAKGRVQAGSQGQASASLVRAHHSGIKDRPSSPIPAASGT